MRCCLGIRFVWNSITCPELAWLPGLMSLRWLPNAISVLRIVLVVPILYLISRYDFSTALLLFIVAGVSDVLDGLLARSFDWQSRIGALLDPLADKLLIAGSFAALWLVGLLPLWLAATVIGRDILIVGGATFYNFLIRPLEGEPTLISKLNTALELLLVLLVLTKAAYAWPDSLVIAVLGAAVLVTVVISGSDYVWSWSNKARMGE